MKVTYEKILTDRNQVFKKQRLEIRRNFFLDGRTKKALLKLQYLNKKQNTIGDCWFSKPHLVFQNPVVLPALPWEPSEKLTIVLEISSNYGTTEVWSRTYCLKLFCPKIVKETVYRETLKIGKFAIEKTNEPTE